MKKIYKYALPLDGKSIQVSDYIIEWLKVDMQNGWPYAWAVVDTEREGMMTEIVAWGTRWILPNDVYYGCEYFGTCEDEYGFVWHYFAKVHQVNSQTTDTLTTQDCYIQGSSDWTTTSALIFNEDYCYDNCPLQTITTLNVNPPTITFSADNVDFDGLIKKLEQYVPDRKTTNNCVTG